jgi:hypothetical protein
MKKLSFVTLLIGLILGGITPTFSQKDNSFYHEVKTYVNPVLPGDHPDPTLLKVGDDFIIAVQAFILHPTCLFITLKTWYIGVLLAGCCPTKSTLGNRPPFGRYLARGYYLFLWFLLDLFFSQWTMV